ncbi:tyrosine-protein phosphatase [Oscillospiraceae bacterium MB08-C2-2]|nr:tyrosine-protein phosphatase [Oscillospiraceae bacterium MB08-C2-2]
MDTLKGYNIIDLEGARNVRDLGGIPCAGGKQTAMGVFIRAAGLGDLTERDQEILLEYGVDCIIDLRSQREVCDKPDSLAEHEKIVYRNIPMLDQVQSNISKQELMYPSSMQTMYMGLLDLDGELIRQVFDLLSDPQYRCMVFHCTAGKDRTGIIAMLLLDLAGVSREDILHNYVISGDLVRPLLRAQEIEGIPSYVFESRPEFMADTYTHLQRKYGGAREYLLAQGNTPQQLESLLKTFVEP